MSDWLAAPIEVIPAVDVLGEGAVRLHRGDYDRSSTRQATPSLSRPASPRPARVGSTSSTSTAPVRRARPELVRTVAAAVAPTPLQASGGIRSLEDARALLAAGADRIVLGTAAFPDPAPWAAALGDRLVVALDVRDGVVRSAGWTAESGLTTERRSSSASPPASSASSAPRSTGTARLPAPTSSSCGSVAASGLDVLAAGGVRSPNDVRALAAAGAGAAVVGRAIIGTQSRS